MAFADDYVPVSERIGQFFHRYPDGSLREAAPFELITIGGETFLAYKAAAYRTPDDAAPGIGCAWEPVPGKTNFTRNSELQNAETSAWGRAILAVGAADAKKGIASLEEVQNRRADQSAPVVDRSWQDAQERDWEWDDLRAATAKLDDDLAADVRAAVKALGFTKSTFTREHAAAWSALLPASAELSEFAAPVEMADQS